MAEEKVDEGLYSRQLYVYGHDAQKKLSNARVLIVGLRGLGVEIAKNIILAGVKVVGLADSEPVELRNLSSQFYLQEEDVGKPCAECCVNQLGGLNGYVEVKVVKEQVTADLLNGYDILVATDKTIGEQKALNELCRQTQTAFVASNALGLLGSVFVDVGAEHKVSDANGEREVRGVVGFISQAKEGVVSCREDERHGLQHGDMVTFEEVEGMTALNGCEPRKVKYISPDAFSIGDTSELPSYTGQGFFMQVKQPIVVQHKPLAECLLRPRPLLVEGSPFPERMHLLHLALSAFRETKGRAVQPDTWADADEVVAKAKQIADELEWKMPEEVMSQWRRLARGSSACLCPMAALLGGIAAQEAIKACSGKFTPLQQWLYFSSPQCLVSEPSELAVYRPLGSRYDDQIAVFGRVFQDQLAKLRYFLVGAGAIGCEMLKNWALMGVGCGGGCIHVTDMDRIERSNLNRQFLFRDGDVGKMKSHRAAAAAVKINPNLRVDAQTLRVGGETEGVFNVEFWENLHGVITALDNVDARLYVDSKCVQFQRALVDSGTLGAKANTQVVVPFQTQSYASSRDPAEADFPICTVKNFPWKIEHTIQWSRETFEGFFRGSCDHVNNFLKQPNYVAKLALQPGTELDALRTIKSNLGEEKTVDFDGCIRWARLRFEEEFSHTIQQLLYNFPPDSASEEGVPFWSGTKRCPTPLKFDSKDPMHFKFIMAAANIRAFNFGLKGSFDEDYIRRVVDAVDIPRFEAKKIRIATTEEEAEHEGEPLDEDVEEVIQELRRSLPSPNKLAGYQLHPAHFEKDDDTNFHMAFITAASNLRARIYRIKEVSQYQAKFIAGKIVPAIATTTASVTGLVCFELYKLLAKQPLDHYRNTYVNMAINMYSASEPIACATSEAVLKDRTWKWGLWDTLDVKLGKDVTLQEFMNHFQEKLGLEISMLTFQNAMLYYDFAMDAETKEKMKKRKEMKMREVIESVSKVQLNPLDKYVRLEPVAESVATGEDVDIPTVCYQFAGF